ncbi:hypothetical protein ACFLY6_01345 [Candidatus Dependentiae bacterium]
MRPANRNFPFSRDVFRTSKHNGLDCSIFFTRSSSTYESLEGQETVTHPWGGYNLKDAIEAYQTYKSDLGESYTNPLQTEKGSDIFNDKDIPFDVLLDQRTFGAQFSFYHMFESAAAKAVSGISMPKGARNFFKDAEIYIGADCFVMHASSGAHYELNLLNRNLNQAVRDMSLTDQRLVDKVRREFQYNDLGMNSNTWSNTGMGDIDIYAGFGKRFDHKLRFRSMDFSAVVGVTIPTCEKFNIDRPLSFTFGSEGVTAHLDFLAEFELKQCWRAGCTLGFTSGYTSTRERRIPVKREPSVLSPLKISPKIKTGMTMSIKPYFTLENIKPGLHLTARYIYLWHENDEWSDERENPTVDSFITRREAGYSMAIELERFENWTHWTASFLNVTAVYDPGERSGHWASRPLVWVSYDHPFNSNSVVRNRRLAVGATLRF